MQRGRRFGRPGAGDSPLAPSGGLTEIDEEAESLRSAVRVGACGVKTKRHLGSPLPTGRGAHLASL